MKFFADIDKKYNLNVLLPAGFLSLFYIILSFNYSYKEIYEEYCYLALIFIFPIIFYFLNIILLKSKTISFFLSCTFLFFIIIIFFKNLHSFKYIFFLSFLINLLFSCKGKTNNFKNFLIYLLLNISFLCLASSLVHFDSFNNLFRSPLLILFTIFIFILSANIINQPIIKDLKIKVNHFDIVIILFFLFFSFRTDSLFIGDSWAHWSYFVGPIETIRQGGLLLYDTPSQYGFLSILIPSILPFLDSWESLFIFQGILLFLIAFISYFLIRSIFSSKFSRLWSFILVSSFLYFSTSNSISPTCIPSGSVIRFFCVYLLIFYFFFNFVFKKKINENIGILLWVFGCLWSIESAIYSSATFLPAFLYASFIDAFKKNSFLVKLFIYKIAKILLFFSSFLIIIVIFYLYKVHDFPDIISYFDYALAYSVGGVGALPIEKISPVWILVCIYSFLLSSFFLLYLKSRILPSLPLVISLFFGFCSIASYYVVRSTPWNITVLIPEISIIVIILYSILKRENLDKFCICLKVFLIHFFSVMILSNTVLKSEFYNFLNSNQSNFFSISKKLPKVDESLNSLLIEANITKNDPIVYIDGNYSRPFSSRWKSNDNTEIFQKLSWLPRPISMLDSLSIDRQKTYINRYIRRTNSGGWLIQSKVNNYNPFSLQLINKYFVPVKKYENNEWILVKYKPFKPFNEK
jgi:hypothetical protein